MIEVNLSQNLLGRLPEYQVGVLAYYDIFVSNSPQMMRGRFEYFQEELKISLESKSITDIAGVAEWRNVFKTFGMDPTRYRPSSEALFRRLKKGNRLPSIHSAVDLNNYFSLKYEIPMGIYNLNQIKMPVEIRIGNEDDQYEAINGRTMNMSGKLLSADKEGAFGSPIVDSKRTMTTENSKTALHLIYLKPSTSHTNAKKILDQIGSSFQQIHGGTFESFLIP